MQVSDNGGVTRVALAGRLDTAIVNGTEPEFFGAIVPRGQNAVIDLSGVTFIASLGIRMLLSTARALGKSGARFVLFGAGPAVAEIIETTALDTIIPVVSTESEAYAVLAG